MQDIRVDESIMRVSEITQKKSKPQRSKFTASNRNSRVKVQHFKSRDQSIGEDELDHSITTISHFDDIYSDKYWQKQVTNLLKEKKQYIE